MKLSRQQANLARRRRGGFAVNPRSEPPEAATCKVARLRGFDSSRGSAFSPSVSPDSQQDFAFAFLSILFEGAPFILLGTLISGFIDIYLPAGTMVDFLPYSELAS